MCNYALRLFDSNDFELVALDKETITTHFNTTEALLLRMINHTAIGMPLIQLRIVRLWLLLMCFCLPLSESRRGIHLRAERWERRVLKGSSRIASGKNSGVEVAARSKSIDKNSPDAKYIKSTVDQKNLILDLEGSEDTSKTGEAEKRSTKESRAENSLAAKSTPTRNKKSQKSRAASRSKKNKLIKGKRSVKEGNKILEESPSIDGVEVLPPASLSMDEPTTMAENNSTEVGTSLSTGEMPGGSMITPFPTVGQTAPYTEAPISYTEEPTRYTEQTTPSPTVESTVTLTSEIPRTESPTDSTDVTAETEVPSASETSLPTLQIDSMSAPTISPRTSTPTIGSTMTSSSEKAETEPPTASEASLPTVNLERTPGPTISLGTEFPTQSPTAELSACPTDVAVEGTFEFNFVVADRSPRNSEIDSLEDTTLSYLIDLFRESLGESVLGISGGIESSQFDIGPAPNFIFDITATVIFSECAPSQMVLDSLITLRPAQLQEYIDSYLLLIEPLRDNIFVLVSTVDFEGTATYF